MKPEEQTAHHLYELGLRASADPADQRAEELVDDWSRQPPNVAVREMCREIRQELTTPPPMKVEGRLAKTAMMVKEHEVFVE
jgi:hypothetical protein